MSGYHSPLSPSGAHRYLRCRAAPAASTGLPSTSSVYAAEGTMLHEIAERCLLDGGDPHRFIGEKFEIDGHHLEMTKDMADCMVADLYDVRDIFTDGELHIETRVKLDWPLGEGESGTADISGKTWNGIIRIDDWKFGEGIKVDAEHNEQMSLYGIGAILEFWPDDPPDTKVHLTIRQPRIRDGNSTWETTIGELMTWAEEVVVPAIAEIKSGTAPFNPGPKQCYWCPAKKGNIDLNIPPCAAHEQFNLGIARRMFTDLDVASLLGAEPTEVPTSSVDPHMRIWLLDHADMFTDWLKDLKDQIHNDLEAGRDHMAPGKKLIEGRAGHRKYKESEQATVEKLARQQLGDGAYDVSLKSPAQLEIALGKPLFDLLFDGLVEQSRGKPIIADMGHPKPALPSLRQQLGSIPESE